MTEGAQGQRCSARYAPSQMASAFVAVDNAGCPADCITVKHPKAAVYTAAAKT